MYTRKLTNYNLSWSVGKIVTLDVRKKLLHDKMVTAMANLYVGNRHYTPMLHIKVPDYSKQEIDQYLKSLEYSYNQFVSLMRVFMMLSRNDVIKLHITQIPKPENIMDMVVVDCRVNMDLINPYNFLQLIIYKDGRIRCL